MNGVNDQADVLVSVGQTGDLGNLLGGLLGGEHFQQRIAGMDTALDSHFRLEACRDPPAEVVDSLQRDYRCWIRHRSKVFHLNVDNHTRLPSFECLFDFRLMIRDRFDFVSQLMTLGIQAFTASDRCQTIITHIDFKIFQQQMLGLETEQ